MSKSIIQKNGREECYVSGSRINLDRHHCLHGIANRKLAEKWGLWVWLRHDIHMSLHEKDKELDRQLEQDAQRAFEEKYGHDAWIKIFRKNYL